jgi:hypothetical protein
MLRNDFNRTEILVSGVQFSLLAFKEITPRQSGEALELFYSVF